MDISKPLLSIVIPTRNRLNYVKSTILSILSIESNQIELVVQDNSDENELQSWINKNISDCRLNYNYSDLPLSFVSNFDVAVSIANGEYVCLIGDDDGINPEIIDAVDWLKQKKIDCLSIRNKANYVWPDSGVPSTVFTKNTNGNLTISPFKGEIVSADMDVQLELFVRDGCSNYLDFDLPKLYHGIVRRQCLIEINQKTGSYFSGLSPDISISISLACIVKSVFITDYPLTLPGVCGVSASIIEGLLKKNSKKIEDAPHLRNRGDYDWSELVPRVYCVETIWADSAIAALKQMKREDLIHKISLSRLAANCIVANKDVSNAVIIGFYKGLRVQGENRIIPTIQLVFFLLFLYLGQFFGLIKRTWNRILMMIGIKKAIRINGLNNIFEATSALSNKLNEMSYKFLKLCENEL